MVNLLAPTVPFEKDRFLQAFGSSAKDSRDPAWLKQVREEAIARFAQLGFPTMRNEEWRYTNVSSFQNIPFQFAPVSTVSQIAPAQIEPFRFGATGWPTLVFVNGRFAEKLSSLLKNHKGLYVGGLNQALASNPKLLEAHLSHYAAQDAFTALNTAFIYDGTLIYLPDGEIVNEPIHLIFVSASSDPNTLIQPRNLIVAGPKSKASIVESYVSIGGAPYLTNSVTEILVGEEAKVDYYKIQREANEAFHIGTTQIELKRAAIFNSVSISFGARLSRHNVNVRLSEEGAVCDLNGLYLGSGEQHMDHHTLVDHPKPRGASHQLYKGILSGQASGVFSGKIFVREGAQKTDAHQNNKNLLLSEKATTDTQPQLEILADDVKCTHGAAVGQLDENAIFYLKTRGIGLEQARRILCYGFAKEVIERIKIPAISKELDRLILSQFSDPAYWKH
jgi:Fe-S cluster assembly protein SufD